MKLISKIFVVALVLGFLSACESAEEKAEKHFQSALELVQSGDDQRAIVEFRNVFKLNGSHQAARKAYADFQRQRGDAQEAVGQYLRLIEQYPDDFDGQLSIAELYAESGNWEGMEVYLAAATDLDADHLRVKALQLIFDYRQAVAQGEYETATDVAAGTSDLLAELPDYMLLRQVEIDDHIRNQAFDQALLRLDDAIKLKPDNRLLYAVRLSVLGALDDPFAIETQLQEMIALFPDDPSSRETLVRWYVSQGQLGEAEQNLRDAAGAENADPIEQLTLIRFLSELRSPEIARAELDKIVSAGNASVIVRSLQAGYQFDTGDTAGAIGTMRELLAELEPGEELQTAKIALAQMLIFSSDEAGAKALVAEVLAENAENIPAIKLRAGWLISDDQVGDAITSLRGALDFSPRDSEIIGLLARAYLRDGNDRLVGEMLSLAMEAANGAPEQTLAYAGYLMSRENYRVAETVLVNSLRLAPDNIDILVDLGRVYIATEDWPRAEQVRATLTRIGTQLSVDRANELQTRMLQGQKKSGEAVAFLSGLVEQGSGGLGAHIAIIESYLADGEAAQAKAYVETLLLDEPKNTVLRFLDATLDVAIGDNGVAEQKYWALLEENPTQVPIWVALFRLLSATGQTDATEKAMEQASAALPDDATIKWVKAGILESQGDIPGAIEVYEGMYALDSDNLIIANNLASLLSTSRQDVESLERAYTIARRLRSSNFPAYQDTYGWIAHLRGENTESIRALESAALGLAQDPQVQFHLASAYLAGKRESDALVYFRKVLELTGGADGRDFVATARSEANRLSSELGNAEGN